MKRDNVNYVLVGVAVLAALVLLIGTLAFITGRGAAATEYHVRYANVTGLKYGAPVFYEGFRIGQVTGIDPERREGRTRYRVEISVRSDWPIPADSVARPMASGLLADMSIGIREGTSSQMLEPGAEIAGAEGGDIFTAMNDLATELTVLTRERIRPMVDTLSLRLDSLSGLIDAEAPELIAQTGELLARLNRAADGLEQAVGPENRAQVSAILADVRAVTRDLEQTQDRADALLDNLDGMVGENRPEIRQAIVDLQHTVGTISQRIGTITHHLESASRNVDEFSREIRRNPNRLLFTPSADEVEE